MIGHGAPSLMDLPNELIVLIVEHLASLGGIVDVLSFALARRRFQVLTYSHAALFREPTLLGGRPGGGAMSLPDVARLSARFGSHFERLCLGGALGPLAALAAPAPGLPGGAVRRLRQVDLSGLAAPFRALRRLLRASAATLARLFLPGVRVLPERPELGLEGDETRRLLRAFEGLEFPRLESVDVSGTNATGDARALAALVARLPALRELYAVEEGFRMDLEFFVARPARRPARLVLLTDPEALEELSAASLRELREHFDGTARPRPEAERFDLARLAAPPSSEVAPPLLPPPRPVTRRPRAALSAGPGPRGLAAARRLVSGLGDSLLRAPTPPRPLGPGRAPSPRPARSRVLSPTPPAQAPPYFRDGAAVAAAADPLVADGATALHVLAARSAAAYYTAASVRQARPPPRPPPRPAPSNRAGAADQGVGPGAPRGRAAALGEPAAALHLAAAHSPALVAVLLAAGADPLLQDAEGATALHVACALGHAEAARALLAAAARAGLDLLAVRDGAGRTPLQRLLAIGAGDERELHASERFGRSLIAAHAVELLGLDGDRLEALGVRRAFLEEPVWGPGGTDLLLHFAARGALPRAARALLDAGAEPARLSGEGVEALEGAEREFLAVGAALGIGGDEEPEADAGAPPAKRPRTA
eukprot:tig00000989_g6106.t1